MITITILTIINTIVLIYLLVKGSKFSIDIRRDETFSKNTLVGYRIMLWKNTDYGSTGIYGIYIPIRNKRKIEIQEEVQRLINDTTNQRYNLNAKFSWLKTMDEVLEFERNYSVVNKEFVDELVEGFKRKHNWYN